MLHYSEFKNIELNENDIFSFDIETSSYWDTDNGIQGYTEDFEPEEYNAFECGAVCYIWQFSINDIVYYGRDLSEFPAFLSVVFSNFTQSVESKKPLLPVVWVHNLAYEFQFIREYIDINLETIFARQKRKPMSFETLKYGKTCIEFRCSYVLTHLSLDAWGKELGFNKLHTLDYTILRTPVTKLTALELAYCERDCLVVYRGIIPFRTKYGTIQAIPKTQTGEVRLEVKNVLNTKKYHNYITKMLPKTEEDYRLLRCVFQGGSTGGNYKTTGQVLYNVGSDDIQSDYPGQMVSQKYPCTAFRECSPADVKLVNFDKYAFILCLRFYELTSKTALHYFSRHKAIATTGGKIDNGKIVSAKVLTVCITEQDLCIFQKCYKWEKMEIIASFKAKKDYLPKEYIEIILERYGYKTTLKGIEEKAEIYAQSKQFINSCYGMMVTDLYQQNAIFTGEEWTTDEGNLQEVLNKLQRYRSRNFLNYAWGCWVTAYARARLWIGSADSKYFRESLGMLATPDDIIYYDTDSRKHYITDDIERILLREDEINEEKLEKMCKHYDIDIERTRPKDPKGKARIIGAWDFEGVYDEFIHLGAKRYATKKNEKIEVTVSGVPKKAGSDMLKDLKDFKDGYNFDANHRDAETGLYDGKMISTYCDGNNLQCVINEGQYDEYIVTNKNSIVLRNTGYKLGLADDYRQLIAKGRERNLF